MHLGKQWLLFLRHPLAEPAGEAEHMSPVQWLPGEDFPEEEALRWDRKMTKVRSCLHCDRPSCVNIPVPLPKGSFCLP